VTADALACLVAHLAMRRLRPRVTGRRRRPPPAFGPTRPKSSSATLSVALTGRPASFSRLASGKIGGIGQGCQGDQLHLLRPPGLARVGDRPYGIGWSSGLISH